MAALITVTGGEVVVSCALKARPRNTGTPSASKYPGVTSGMTTEGLLCASAMLWPSITKLSDQIMQSGGRAPASAAVSTPGRARTRSSSCV